MFNNLGVLMKKLVLAALVALSVPAFADTSFTVIDGVQKDQATKADTHVNVFDLKTDLSKNLAGDLMIINKSSDTNVITNRTEVGLTYEQGIAGLPESLSRWFKVL